MLERNNQWLGEGAEGICIREGTPCVEEIQMGRHMVSSWKP